ncbi:unnamed protein product (macronuclear) [Paramecium tetraurelia]|uniref:Uncharacterized protein n=1 Tax=Paramecium tetraurelia TaxID=5888 RepID=A0BZM2_PARTE|nr:uncharacterized protein GSPATT00005841001 [Paramecium tetraurelia]CAK63989.1 unnamed protein product [Paramecium tetraurelia]|eukprot:XP_001431387.1 hypothetical protein (macronuclear) [Paramecium tetraurelia strain d4-2]
MRLRNKLKRLHYTNSLYKLIDDQDLVASIFPSYEYHTYNRLPYQSRQQRNQTLVKSQAFRNLSQLQTPSDTKISLSFEKASSKIDLDYAVNFVLSNQIQYQFFFVKEQCREFNMLHTPQQLQDQIPQFNYESENLYFLLVHGVQFQQQSLFFISITVLDINQDYIISLLTANMGFAELSYASIKQLSQGDIRRITTLYRCKESFSCKQQQHYHCKTKIYWKFIHMIQYQGNRD